MKPVPPPDARQRLISAGIDLFGQKGRDGVSTREVAKAAGVNIAGIAYHFGGKDQLHLACAEHIAKTIQSGIGANLVALPDGLPALDRLKRTIAGIAQFMLGTPGTASFARFVLREQMDPSPAFEVLYAHVMEPMHRRLCRLWSEATGDGPETEATRLRVFTILSPLLFFRMAEAGATRRMGWRAMGPAQIAAIVAAVTETCDALLSDKDAKP